MLPIPISNVGAIVLFVESYGPTNFLLQTNWMHETEKHGRRKSILPLEALRRGLTIGSIKGDWVALEQKDYPFDIGCTPVLT